MSRKISIEEIRNRPEIEILKKLPGVAQPLINGIFKKVLHLDEINEILGSTDKKGVDFLIEMTDNLEIDIRVTGKENIPKKGRAIFVCNHPTGLGEIAVLRAILDVRRDIYDVADPSLVELFPELEDMLIIAPSHDRPESKIVLAVSSVRKSMELLLKEKGLVFFPSGTVASKHQGKIEEERWKNGPTLLARQTNAPVIPIYTDAENSDLFYQIRNLPGIGNIASTAMMIDALFRQRGKTINLTVKPPISSTELRKVNTPAGTRILRDACLN